MNVHWISIFGSIEATENQIKYIPYQITEGSNQGNYGIANAKSNIEFENGIITFKVFLKNPKSICQIILNHGTQNEINIGLNLGKSAYGMAAYKAGKWEHISAVGYDQTPNVEEWIPVKIKVSGSIIELYVYEIKACAGIETIVNSQLGIAMGGVDGEVLVKDIHVKGTTPQIFVVMQFTEQYNELYNEVIRPTCESYGYECIRADDMYTNKLIIEDIVQYIKESSIVIADITPNNPNVFYEVGYAHGSGKPTILLSDKKREQVPFDVSGFRTLFYDNTIGGKAVIEERLKKHLDNIKS